MFSDRDICCRLRFHNDQKQMYYYTLTFSVCRHFRVLVSGYTVSVSLIGDCSGRLALQDPQRKIMACLAPTPQRNWERQINLPKSNRKSTALSYPPISTLITYKHNVVAKSLPPPVKKRHFYILQLVEGLRLKNPIPKAVTNLSLKQAAIP